MLFSFAELSTLGKVVEGDAKLARCPGCLDVLVVPVALSGVDSQDYLKSE